MLPNQKSALGFALLLTTVATTKPLESFFVPPTLAQAAPPSFPLPSSVPPGTKVQVDGSSSMAAINQALKQQFEQQFPGSNINLTYSGTPAGLQALREGKVDLAAIGRPLTEAERRDGLVPVALERGKIAIITSPDNPFKGSITVPQFVKIVRGEITDWSELGGTPGKIRFVDRPDLSDTRAAFRNYSVFIQSPYEVGGTGTRTPEDSTQAIAQQLGKDGLSYAPANQVLNQPNFRIVPMHNTLPTDPRYPFSQPFYYVHKATPSAGAAALLGYTTSDSGRQTVQTAENNPGALSLDPATLLAAGSAATVASFNTGAGAGSSPSPTQSPAGAASPGTTSSTGSTSPGATSGTGADGQGIIGQAPNGTATGQSASNNEAGLPGWLWWLLPLGLGALLLGWFLRSRRSTPPTAAVSPAEVPPVAPPPAEPTITPPPPPPLMTPVEPDLASRTGSVISSDRAAIAEAQPPSIPPAAALGGAAIAGAGAAYAASQLGRSEEPPTTDLPSIEEPVIAEEPPAVEEPVIAATDLPSIEETIIAPAELPTLAEPVLEAEPPALAEPVLETPSVPERPLVEIREMPAIEMTPPSIEPPEAPPESDFNLPGAAALGAVGLGAAAWMSRTRSGVPPESEPLASLDAIEALDEPEDALLDQPPIELDLDDAPTIVEETSPVSEAAVVDPEPQIEAAIEPEILDESPAIVEASDLEVMEAEPLPEVENAIVDQALSIMDNSEAEVIELEEPPIIAETSEAEPPSSIPGLAAIGGAAALAAGIAGMAGSRSEDEGGNLESSEPEAPQPQEIAPMIDASQPDPVESSSDDSALPGIAAVGGLAAGIAGMAVSRSDDAQTTVESARFDVGQTDLSSESLAAVDEGLPDLPDGYGESRIVLMPRDPQWAYAYWDIPNEHKAELRNQGGQNLVLRLYDVTDIDIQHQSPHSLQQFDCDEMARDWYLPIPVSDRDYITEIGYLTGDGRWLMLARSLPVRIPPTYPSAWENDQFITINWDEDLSGKTFLNLGSPDSEGVTATPNGMYDQIFNLSQGAELQRIAGSIFGSMQQVPTSAVSSFVFPSGMGMWALPTVSGMSGIGMSGVGMFSGSAIPARPRKFWLVADAELIIYGATEPDATVSIAGETIPLNPDGTFRFQMSFQDGLIDYPILAVAKDGEQTRSIHLKFTRETPNRNTNTKDEAIDEWQA